LWTNPSPTASYGEGNIATGIDFKGFTAFAVKVRSHTSVEKYIFCMVILAVESQMSFVTDSTTSNANVNFRYITINNGNIHISAGTKGNGDANASILIPVEVYGIW
jgi:hypothetical protein